MPKGTRKFLLIEDEETVLTALTLALENRGVEIDVADTGERGLELLAAGCYDLVIDQDAAFEETIAPILASLRSGVDDPVEIV